VEDLVDFLTTIHADKAKKLNKEEKKPPPTSVVLKRNENNKVTTPDWDQVERRHSKDRRRIKVNRGRWLDSRQQTDRRKNLVFYTQI